MARIRAVLARPESPANIGAVARVITNTGLEGLDLVDPGDWRTIEAWRMAWRAEDILEQTRLFETLAQALEGAVVRRGLRRAHRHAGRADHRQGDGIRSSRARGPRPGRSRFRVRIYRPLRERSHSLPSPGVHPHRRTPTFSQPCASGDGCRLRVFPRRLTRDNATSAGSQQRRGTGAGEARTSVSRSRFLDARTMPHQGSPSGASCSGAPD